ncbi:MAG TPA: hypothetical protein GX402_07085 [Bacteroidales bacterium]|nr:hypothetical protein [Bacteroidales bacterium]
MKKKKFKKLLYQNLNSDKRKDKRYIDLFYQIYNDSKNSNLKLDESFKESLKIDTTDNIIKKISYSMLKYAVVMIVVLAIGIIAGIGISNNFLTKQEAFLQFPNNYFVIDNIHLKPQTSNELISKNKLSTTILPRDSNKTTINNNDTTNNNLAKIDNLKTIKTSTPIIQVKTEVDTAELIDTKIFYQGLENIARIIEMEDNDLYEIEEQYKEIKTKDLLVVWQDIKNFISDGQVPFNVSVTNIFNLIKNVKIKNQKY